MKKIYWITLLCTLCYFTYGQNNKYNKDKLKFNTYIYDVGVINKDTIITKEYLYENISSDTIKIIDLDKSCTCTNLFINRVIIPPKEKGLVRLTLDTKDKYGRFLVNGILVTNTPQKYYKLIITGNKK